MTSDTDTFPYTHKAAEYSYRVPTPPRIVVPPPALNAHSMPDITLKALQSAGFLNNVNYQNIITQNVILEWTYERRREAQMILPYLYLGPMTAAKDERFLRGEKGHGTTEGGITMVLGVRQKHAFESRLMNGALTKARNMGIETQTVELANNQDLIHNLPQTVASINDHLARMHQQTGKLGRVLVVCESGNERGAGVVAAYLMETHVDVDHIKAIQLVQAQRFCANFDDAMKRLLQGYWDILCAKREVADANGPSSPLGLLGASTTRQHGPAKRPLQEDEDEDMDMEGTNGGDMVRFQGRKFAPFVDQP